MRRYETSRSQAAQPANVRKFPYPTFTGRADWQMMPSARFFQLAEFWCSLLSVTANGGCGDWGDRQTS